MSIPNNDQADLEQHDRKALDHPSTAATATFAVETLLAGTFRVTAIEILNPTGLAQDPANYFSVSLLAGATTIGTFSTLTGAQGTITANTSALFVLSATDANCVAPQGSLLKLVFTKTGTQTFPAGRIVVHGRYIA